MDTYKERIVIELNELNKKYEDLKTFLSSEMFETLSTTSKELLNKQVNVMKEYADILELRLEL